MVAAACSDQDFISLFTQLGAIQTAKHLGVAERRVYERRRNLEKKYGRPIHAPSKTPTDQHPERREMKIDNGVVLVGSDAHYWPERVSTAHRAFVKACRDMKPRAVVMNGDAFDGASISRHAPMQFEENPTVADEIEACRERLGEIQDAAGKAKLYWTLGNHDARFEARLATVAPEYVRVDGIHLKDHFPDWLPCWSLWINDEVVIKHRWKGGIHATHNNAVQSGKTMVTGHLHSLKVTPWTDYNGTRFGVDTGCLADTFGPQFLYTEDNSKNWRSGFAVLTFENGKLRWPEVVNVVEPGIVEFRGESYAV